MAKSIDEDEVTVDEARMALSLIELGGQGVKSGAVLLARDDPMRVIWANSSATRLFGSTDADRLTAFLFGDQRTGPQFGAGLRRLGSYTLPRLERLRLTSGLQTRTVTAEVSRTTLANGKALYGIVLQGSAPEPGDGWSRSALSGHAVEPIATNLVPHAVTVPSSEHDREEVGPPHADRPPAARARRSTRLTWQTDEAGRVTAAVSHAGPLAGQIDDGLIGRDLCEVLLEHGGDPDHLFAAAMGARDTFGRLALGWPLRGGGTVAVHAGGVPILGVDGRFQGFRGFATIDARQDSVAPAPLQVPAEPQAAIVSQPSQPIASDSQIGRAHV